MPRKKREFTLKIPTEPKMEEVEVEPWNDEDEYYTDNSEEAERYYLAMTYDDELIGISRDKSKCEIYCRRWNRCVNRSRARVVSRKEIKIPETRFYIAEFQNKTLKYIHEVFSFKFDIIEHRKNYHKYKIEAKSLAEATEKAFDLHLKYYSKRVNFYRTLRQDRILLNGEIKDKDETNQ